MKLSFKDRLIAAMVIAFLKLLAALPFSVTQALGRGLGRLLYWLPNSQKEVARCNLAAAYPDLSGAERQILLKDLLQQSAQSIFELGPFWIWPKDKLMERIEKVSGEALLNDALQQEKGILFLAPHFGAWELIGPYLSSRFPSTFMYRPPNLIGLDDFMVESRGRFGADLAPTDLRGVRKLIQALNQGQISVILPDQDPGEKGSVYAPFFKRPARTMTLVNKLLQKADCAVMYVVMQRLPNGRFHLHFLPAEEALTDRDELIAAGALNRGVEACIAVAPEQYLWSYKRYRKPPPGWKDVYR
ncbi:MULTISPECIES: lysophospholipid acyltransferase family protein [Thiomicrorhabdus]|uniref:Lysophospholipid acyltransferase family protein n=1 Tax=Thiomicrorhabdus heinhorstiae TaxID=2748010 RepID=A0ABS0BVW7_9GAMM|nr:MULTISPECIES: lysophospholipid acyltransferase family protein [Thiomicrorhabdus]MBF6057519.1 lysophospholipid acyltransferase family protein [Thiomicrorhabdus heinhorstiae]